MTANTLMRRYTVLVILMLSCSSIFSLSAQEEQQQTVHIVQPGENLFRIALQYGISVDELASANNITNVSRIDRGQELVIPGVYAPTTESEGEAFYNPLIAGTPTIHVVQYGESLNAVARRYDVSPEDILRANNIANANLIYAGQELTIWTAAAAEAAVTEADELAEQANAAGVATSSDNMITYEVRPGDLLSRIAERHGVSWTTIAQVNGIADPDRLFAGQLLQIPRVDENGQVLLDDMGIIVRSGPGATISVGKQIVVDLSEQKTYAYENGVLVYDTLVSTGLPGTPTVTGDYQIYHRTRSQRMVGPDYDLDNVEWVQYFFEGYSLHGTYRHNNFGRPMSHGCVNMTNEAAQWFYEWADYGTPVHVQY
jgi:LysM repeat protein